MDPLKAARGGLVDARRDPLRWFDYACEAHRRVVRYLYDGLEVGVRSGNQAGKTFLGSRILVALSRGAESLGGERLPVFDQPSNWAVLGKSYKQMGASSLAAVREALGDWPHRVDFGPQRSILGFRVKPERSRSDDPDRWSRIIALPEDGEKPVGLRLDGAWGDEPPREDYWHELRARGRANRRFARWITFTPEDRREWAWLRREFEPCPEPGRDGRVEVVTSVFDNRMLGPEHLKELERLWKDDPLLEARLHGEYLDLVGQCPFDRRGMKRWRDRVRAPERIERISVDGWEPFEVEVWFEPGDEPCMVLADPSAGVRDARGENDPAGVIVVGRATRRVLARWNGYVPATFLGRLSRRLAERHNRALVVWERNSGYGEPFYMGLEGYGNVYVDTRTDSLRLSLYDRLGWTTTAATRGAIVGALQKAVLEDSLVVLSGAMLTSMAEFVMQRTGKFESGSGRHDEDVILLGLAAHLLEVLPFYPGPVLSAGERFERDVLKVEREDERAVDEAWRDV